MCTTVSPVDALESRRSQAVTVSPLPLPPLQPVPFPLERAAPAAPLGPKASRPELVPPSQPHPSISISSFMTTVEEIGKEYRTVVEASGKSLQQAYSAVYEEQQKYLQESEKEKQSRDWWDFLRKIAFCLAGTASIVIGGITLASGGGEIAASICGGSLVLSGMASILGSSLDAAGVHPKIATALTLVGSVTALLSGGLANYFGVLTVQGILEKMVAGFIAVSMNTTQMMRAIKDMQLTALQGKLAKTENRATMTKKQMQQLADNCMDALKHATTIATHCAEAQRSELQAQEQITRGQDGRV